MRYFRAGLLPACLLILAGCAGNSEHARDIQHSQARDECRSLTDASAYLECKRRADNLHHKR